MWLSKVFYAVVGFILGDSDSEELLIDLNLVLKVIPDSSTEEWN